MGEVGEPGTGAKRGVLAHAPAEEDPLQRLEVVAAAAAAGAAPAGQGREVGGRNLSAQAHAHISFRRYFFEYIRIFSLSFL